MILYLLIFSTILLLIILLKYISLSHPLFIYIGLTLFTIFGYTILNFPTISNKTTILYFTTILSFFMGYILFISFKNKQITIMNYIIVPNFSNNYHIIMLCLGIVVVIGMGLQGLENASHGSTGNFFLDLRLQHLKNPALFGFYPHMVLYLQVYLLLVYFSSTKHIKKIVMFFLFISIYGSFWKMERTGMMMSIFALIIAMIIKNNVIMKNKINYTKFLLFIVLIIGIFVSITMSRSSVGIDIALNSLSEYMFKSIYTFDRYVLPYAAYGDYGRYFGTVGDVFLKPFFPYDKLDIYVEDLFTVYTYLIGPYIYGGAKLLYFTFFVIGLFYAFIYSKVLKNNIYFMVFYSFYSFTIFMSFFTYIYSWNHWIYFAIILSFIYFTVPKKRISLE